MFLETTDLIVDELCLDDAEAFHRICNQPFILKWMDDWEMNLSQVKGLISHFIKGYEAKDPMRIPFILAVRTNARKLIGICGFGPKDELGGNVEIAYFIDEAFAGKGYMSQVVEKAVEFFFSLTCMPFLCALVDEENAASKRILIKNGFVFHTIDDPDSLRNIVPHYRRYNKQ